MLKLLAVNKNRTSHPQQTLCSMPLYSLINIGDHPLTDSVLYMDSAGALDSLYTAVLKYIHLWFCIQFAFQATRRYTSLHNNRKLFQKTRLQVKLQLNNSICYCCPLSLFLIKLKTNGPWWYLAAVKWEKQWLNCIYVLKKLLLVYSII